VARRILIVDDHAAFRTAARRLLEADSYDVVGEAPDGESALAATRSLAPDVVLLDVQMPGIDGFEVAARLRAAGGAPAIVMVSSRDRDDFGGLIEQSGVRAFIPKDSLTGPALAAALG
jgi:DNA-binding NarL/FixJ family response regulator